MPNNPSCQPNYTFHSSVLATRLLASPPFPLDYKCRIFHTLLCSSSVHLLLCLILPTFCWLSRKGWRDWFGGPEQTCKMWKPAFLMDVVHIWLWNLCGVSLSVNYFPWNNKPSTFSHFNPWIQSLLHEFWTYGWKSHVADICEFCVFEGGEIVL